MRDRLARGVLSKGPGGLWVFGLLGFLSDASDKHENMEHTCMFIQSHAFYQDPVASP